MFLNARVRRCWQLRPLSRISPVTKLSQRATWRCCFFEIHETGIVELGIFQCLWGFRQWIKMTLDVKRRTLWFPITYLDAYVPQEKKLWHGSCGFERESRSTQRVRSEWSIVIGFGLSLLAYSLVAQPLPTTVVQVFFWLLPVFHFAQPL